MTLSGSILFAGYLCHIKLCWNIKLRAIPLITFEVVTKLVPPTFNWITHCFNDSEEVVSFCNTFVPYIVMLKYQISWSPNGYLKSWSGLGLPTPWSLGTTDTMQLSAPVFFCISLVNVILCINIKLLATSNITFEVVHKLVLPHTIIYTRWYNDSEQVNSFSAVYLPYRVMLKFQIICY